MKEFGMKSNRKESKKSKRNVCKNRRKKKLNYSNK
jgi:hypothetical protein